MNIITTLQTQSSMDSEADIQHISVGLHTICTYVQLMDIQLGWFLPPMNICLLTVRICKVENL
jgi:hypothetical protein